MLIEGSPEEHGGWESVLWWLVEVLHPLARFCTLDVRANSVHSVQGCAAHRCAAGSLEAEGAKPRQGVQNLDQPPRSAVSIAGCSCGMLREHRPRAAAALSGPKGDMSSVT